MGLWPSSAMMLALQLLEPGRACGRKEWMGLWPPSALMLALQLPDLRTPPFLMAMPLMAFLNSHNVRG